MRCVDSDPRIEIPYEHAGGVWANHVDVILGEHEVTLDFVRLDFRTGMPPTEGIVVARVACPPAVVGRLIRLAAAGLDEYSSRLGEESFDG